MTQECELILTVHSNGKTASTSLKGDMGDYLTPSASQVILARIEQIFREVSNGEQNNLETQDENQGRDSPGTEE